ncbi:hypothetical protein HPB50_021713 [Hyalomma asiaticum]|uniref:Uncharacterized protein n=1 Tax=Hyalomma asiaticum TaxID=266040 RepID=A0ACB7TBT2_HYAAI|nr:hypothetical protein HPB50_021713 [Hyalomma asiaticum]
MPRASIRTNGYLNGYQTAWIGLKRNNLRPFASFVEKMALPFSRVPFRVACVAAADAQRRRLEVDDTFEDLTYEEQRFRLSKPTPSLDATEPVAFPQRGSFQSSVGREEHIGMAQSAVSNTIYEVTEAIIISVAARAARRKLVDFPPTPWLPRMRRRRRLRYSATSQAC